MGTSTENENDTNIDGGGARNMYPSNESPKVKVFMYSGEQDKYLRRVREYTVDMMDGIVHDSADSIDSGEYCMVCERKSHNAKIFWSMKLGEYMRYETNR